MNIQSCNQVCFKGAYVFEKPKDKANYEKYLQQNSIPYKEVDSKLLTGRSLARYIQNQVTEAQQAIRKEEARVDKQLVMDNLKKQIKQASSKFKKLGDIKLAL